MKMAMGMIMRIFCQVRCTKYETNMKGDKINV